MSRIGKNPIEIPDGVKIDLKNQNITVAGQKGSLELSFHKTMTVTESNGKLIVDRSTDEGSQKALHGTTRQLIQNMVTGVSEGFTKELELVGVGYRASNSGQKLDLSLGFSHTIVLDIAPEVKVEAINEKGQNPIIKLTSMDKQLVGHVAAKIRSFRKPEPYKGKGIKFVGEQIRRKAGKSA